LEGEERPQILERQFSAPNLTLGRPEIEAVTAELSSVVYLQRENN
jgi:hypothetical protein